MSILKIARMGLPILSQKAAPVPDPGAPDIRRLVADMIETMDDVMGAGLAAPQVHVPLRVFVFRVRDERSSGRPGDDAVLPTVLINPGYTPVGDEMEDGWEGCLSIPGLQGCVPRHARIRYHGVDCDGQRIEREVSGFHARVVQHEYDHLDGILYPSRMTDHALFGYTEELMRAAKQK